MDLVLQGVWEEEEFLAKIARTFSVMSESVTRILFSVMRGKVACIRDVKLKQLIHEQDKSREKGCLGARIQEEIITSCTYRCQVEAGLT